MPYTRRTWQNAPSSATPVTATALNNIEDGVEVAYEAVTGRLSEANLESAIGAQFDALNVAVPEVLGVGNSLMAAGWIDSTVEPALGFDVRNVGRSGWASSDIALLDGALDLAVTVTGNQIPASGPVTITARTPTVAFRTGHTGTGHTYTWTGTLAGVAGVLTHEHDTDTWFFTRSVTGSVVACPPGSLFHCTENDDYRARAKVIWASHNNYYSTGVMADALGDIFAMIQHTTHRDKFVVIGEMGASVYPRTHALYAAAVAFNNACAAAFGAKFIDVRRFLIDNGHAYAGLTPTAQDRTDIENDVVPDSFRSDAVHLNATGYGIVAALVLNRLRALGLYDRQKPVGLLSQHLTLTAGATTSSSQVINWTAITDAVGYAVEYRPRGSSTWVLFTGTTGLTATVTGLDEATSYEFQVTPVNAAGRGKSSERIAVVTSGTAPTVITSDTFDRANSGSLGNTDAAFGGSALAWTASGLSIIGGKLARTNTTFYLVQATVDLSAADHYAEAVFDTISDGDTWIVARYTDANNHYGVQVTAAGNLLLRSVLAGSTVTLKQINNIVRNGDRVGISVQGSRIRAFLNGTTVADITNTTVTTGNSAGVRLSNDLKARVDNFLARNR